MYLFPKKIIINNLSFLLLQLNLSFSQLSHSHLLINTAILVQSPLVYCVCVRLFIALVPTLSDLLLFADLLPALLTLSLHLLALQLIFRIYVDSSLCGAATAIVLQPIIFRKMRLEIVVVVIRSLFVNFSGFVRSRVKCQSYIFHLYWEQQ